MDFSAVKTEAIDFVNKSRSGLTVTRVDEGSCQIHLLSGDGNVAFYISCPSSESLSWNVWSDSGESQQVMQYVMDSCNLDASNSVSAVLEMIAKKLQAALQMKNSQAKATKTSEEDECSDAEVDEDENDGDFDSYYAELDADAQADHEMTERNKREEEEDKLASNFFNHKGSEMAVKRLLKDLKAISSVGTKYGLSAAPLANNLFVWEVQLLDIPEDSKLGTDLAKYAKKYKTEPIIHLNMQFPQDYPFSPPFIRVVKPRFQFLTGHVTIGGSICMQMLTKSGWQPTNDIESILVQVRAEILSDPNAALDDIRPNLEYSESEAKSAFERMIQKYGW